MTNGDVKSLLCNFSTLDAASAFQASKEKLVCNICEEAAAAHRCLECSEFFCDDCCRPHRKMKATRDHNVQTIAEFKEEPVLRTFRKTYCPTHPEPKEMHELTLCCKTCDHKPICYDCIVIDHKDHDYGFLHQLAQDQRAEISALLAEVRERGDVSRAAMTRIAACCQDVTERQASAEAEIDALFNQAYDTLRARQKEALNTVHMLMKEKQKTLEAQAEALATFQSSLSSSTSYVHRMLGSGSDAEVMLSKPVLIQRLKELQQQECVLEPAASADLWVDQDSQSLYSVIAGFGAVHALNVDAGRCTAEGAGLSGTQILDMPSEFVVTLRDAEGELTKCVSDTRELLKVEAHMVDAVDARMARSTAVPVDVAPGPHPARTCSYTPTVEGRLRVSVLVRGRHIPGSPFAVKTAKQLFPVFTLLDTSIGTSADGRRITHDATGATGIHFAVATPSISDGVFLWDVNIHHMVGNTWILMGVIANTAPISQSYADNTNYGWASDCQVYIGGKNMSGHDGWPKCQPWQVGDAATFKLDCKALTLSMKHKRLNRTFSITGLPAGKTWHIHANLYGLNDSLEILPPSEEF